MLDPPCDALDQDPRYLEEREGLDDAVGFAFIPDILCGHECVCWNTAVAHELIYRNGGEVSESLDGGVGVRLSGLFVAHAESAHSRVKQVRYCPLFCVNILRWSGVFIAYCTPLDERKVYEDLGGDSADQETYRSVKILMPRRTLWWNVWMYGSPAAKTYSEDAGPNDVECASEIGC